MTDKETKGNHLILTYARHLIISKLRGFDVEYEGFHAIRSCKAPGYS